MQRERERGGTEGAIGNGERDRHRKREAREGGGVERQRKKLT